MLDICSLVCGGSLTYFTNEMGAGVVSSHAITVTQAAGGAGGCIAGVGITSLLFILSFIHSFIPANWVLEQQHWHHWL